MVAARLRACWRITRIVARHDWREHRGGVIGGRRRCRI
jgi:hypothetical protein